ncbi:MAG: hypothetical protein IH820_14425 [Bacteroidetes bacterium]|nr:hypothetical protein [Bacteroidota bacterium]
MQHPNVVAIYAVGHDDGQAYLAAEFVEGADERAEDRDGCGCAWGADFRARR